MREDRGHRRRVRGTRWRTPVWRDPAWWLAVVVTVALIAVQAVLVTNRSSWLVWPGLAVQGLVTWLVVSAVIRIRVGISRGLQDGHDAVERAARADPSGHTAGEKVARTAGRSVGRAVRAYRRARDDGESS